MDTPGNTVSTFPTRQFIFVLDPDLTYPIQIPPNRRALNLIIDLKSYVQPVEIDMLLPDYLMPPGAPIGTWSFYPKPPIHPIKEPKGLRPLELDHDMPQPIRLNLLKEDQESKRCLALLSLTNYFQADGLITVKPLLIDARYPLYQHHRLRIIPLDELSDIVEVCAHGHSIFWSTFNQDRNLTVDLFYQLAHWKGTRYYKWFNSIPTKIKGEDLKNNLRTALLNRYPFILYARDMVRFYELQGDYYFRRGLNSRFFMPLGYHLNNFYLLLWGMLEQLTLIAKHSWMLRINERDCGIKSNKFWEEFSQKEPSLMKFITTGSINEWISKMADMRHSAAHKIIQMPTELYIETEESKKSEAEVVEIVRKENAELLAVFPEDMKRLIESQLIFQWRMKKMKRIGHNIVVIDKKHSGYVWSPVISIDYDLAYLNAVMDAFLAKMILSWINT
jgi:hypothetical protein